MARSENIATVTRRVSEVEQREQPSMDIGPRLRVLKFHWVSFNRNTVQKAARRGSPDPAAFGPQVSNRRRKPRRWETFGQTCVRGRETRAQLASFASLNGIAFIAQPEAPA